MQKKILILILSLASIHTSLFCQSSVRIDSLRKAYQEQDGQERLRTLCDLSIEYRTTRDAIDSIGYYAEIVLNSPDLDKGSQIESSANFNLGLMHWMKGDFDSAKEKFLVSKDISEEAADSTKVHKIYQALGVVSMLSGSNTEALKYYHEAIEGAKKIKDNEVLGTVYSNISLIYKDIGNQEGEVENLKKSIPHHKMSQSPNRYNNLTIAYLNLYDHYRGAKDYQSCDSILQILDSFPSNAVNQRNLARTKISKIRYAEETGDFIKMEKYSRELVKEYEVSGGFDLNITSYAYYYVAYSLILKGRIKEAESYIGKIEAFLANAQGDLKQLLYSQISNLYEEAKLFDKAFPFTIGYYKLRDSISGEQQKKEILTLKEEFEAKEREQEIQNLNLENQLQKNKIKRNQVFTWIFLLSAGLLAMFLSLLYQRKKLRDKDHINQLEQKMLSLQMNPHFIFNAISSIQNYLFEKSDLKIANTYLSTFARLMRQILENSREKFITLDEELDALRNYLDLQKLRYNNAFDYEIKLDEDIIPEVTKIPPLIAQPFVENAIEHGMVYKMENGKIVINISMEKDRLKVAIEDNGLGIKNIDTKIKNPEGKKKSLATILTKERLDLLSKSFKRKFELHVTDNIHDGTSVTIDLPNLQVV